MADNKKPKTSSEVISQVAERIDNCDNVLVALSKDPSVDELSAALGLTFILDKLGKHATAIFSGAVPNAIEFLEPEKTFETNTNSLQDFIIALDKDKADHLRYKIDGDYVKVFITPYKTTLDESDMEFSHGDYNVDLVIALNVESASDLDGALTEYGRIMHDASSINIHAGEPGRFGDLEWGDSKASSVSEMICNLVDQLTIPKEKVILDKSTATALLAGIVAATNRFSNERTTAETMAVASRLMAAGADQQLISSSIPVDILTSDVVDATTDAAPEEPATPPQEEIESAVQDLPAAEPAPAEEPAAKPAPAPEPAPVEEDPTSFSIQHGAVDFDPNEDVAPETPAEEPAAEPAPAPEPAPVAPIALDPAAAEKADALSKLDEIVSAPSSPATDGPLMEELKNAAINEGKKNLVPPSEENQVPEEPKDYAAMMSAELSAPTPPAAPQDNSNNGMPVNVEPVDFSTYTPEPAGPTLGDAPVYEAPAAPAPAPAPEPAPVEEPAPVPTPESMVSTAEYVENPLPMPDANTILPPPPLPFDPNLGQSMAPAPAPAPAPEPQTAQAFVDGLQANNPAVQSTPPAEPVMVPQVTPVMPEVTAAPAPTPAPATDPVMPGVIQPAGEVSTAAEEANSDFLGSNPSMQDQVYPDPSAYHIPGM